MHISSITASFSQDIYRVCADVDGEPLWFESADVGLLSSPEAFASAMLIPALARGERLTRFEKLPLIAAEPLVRRRLRVCWENRAPSGNCSRCDKCVRTRLALLGCGELANFPVFEGEESLVQHIDDLPPSRSQLLTHRRLVNQDNISPEIKQALLRLIERSDRAKRREESAWRKFLRREE